MNGKKIEASVFAIDVTSARLRSYVGAPGIHLMADRAAARAPQRFPVSRRSSSE